MKVFISWSGERSKQVAVLLDSWIQCVLQAVDPWLSSKDIDRGSLWFSEITNQLSHTQNGIICLTKANLNKPWILFEAGALAKGLSSNRVYTFLIDLTAQDIKDPLAQFNHTTGEKDDVYQLIRTINNGLDENALKENILSNVFETYWPQFENKFNDILNNTTEEEKVEERPKEDLLSEILYSVRAIDKRLRRVEDVESLSPSRHFKNRPIEDLNLSARTFNVLKAMRINNVEDLLKIDFEVLTKTSPKTQEEILRLIDDLQKGLL